MRVERAGQNIHLGLGNGIFFTDAFKRVEKNDNSFSCTQYSRIVGVGRDL